MNLIVAVPLDALSFTPPAVIASVPTATTATRRSHVFALEYGTMIVETPNASCGPPVMRTPRTTLPVAPEIVVVPGSETDTVFAGGTAGKVVVFPSYGS